MTQTTDQTRFAEILKGKGIGPEASKSLNGEQCEQVLNDLSNNNISLTTRATMLTALLLLDPNEEEQKMVRQLIESPSSYLPSELQEFLLPSKNPFLRLIRKVIGREDLTAEEAETAMDHFFDRNDPEYLKASFLEAERLKRESFTENQVFLRAMWKRARRTITTTRPVIDLCDGYDGCTRTLSFTPFVAALLASAGYATILHSVDRVAPKEGFTAHGILKALDKNPLISLEEAQENVEDPATGWAYIDQQTFFPELYELRKMRQEMVKRPFLATFEKVMQPVQSEEGNHIVTGYTHKHYREELVQQLKKQGQASQTLLLKGAEGSTQVRMDKPTIAVLCNGNTIVDEEVEPANFELEKVPYDRREDVSAEESAQQGLAALEGEKNYARANMIYTATLILERFGLMNGKTVPEFLAQCLDSGKTKDHWEQGNR